MTTDEVHGLRVERLDPDGPTIWTDEQTSDLFGNAWYDHTDVLAVPVALLDESFFDLSTGHAGEIVRKSVNYGIRLAIVGDVSAHESASDAFAAFVWEVNRGDHIWFVPDAGALDAKLAHRAAPH
jgi:hypothetical protein